MEKLSIENFNLGGEKISSREDTFIKCCISDIHNGRRVQSLDGNNVDNKIRAVVSHSHYGNKSSLRQKDILRQRGIQVDSTGARITYKQNDGVSINQSFGGFRTDIDSYAGIDNRIIRSSSGLLNEEEDISNFVDISAGRAPNLPMILRPLINNSSPLQGYEGFSSPYNRGNTPEVNFTAGTIQYHRKNWRIKFTEDVYTSTQDASMVINPFVINSIEEKMIQVNNVYNETLNLVGAFGIIGNNDIKGLVNLPGITPDTTTFTTPISTSITDAELNSFAKKMINSWLVDNPDRKLPNQLILPTKEWFSLSLANANASFINPQNTRLQILENSFRAGTGIGNFKILRWNACSKTFNQKYGVNKERYILMRRSPDIFDFDLPVPLTHLAVFNNNPMFNSYYSVAQIGGVHQAYSGKRIQYYDLAV